MPRSIVAPLFSTVALPAALAACGSVEIVPYDTPGATGGGPAVVGTGGSGAGGEDASPTGSGGAPPDPVPAPSCTAAECAVSVAAGAPKCAVAASGKVFCWWGGVMLEERLTGGPVERPGLGDIVAASGLAEQMCFLHATRRVSCQGFSHEGQLGQAVPVGASSAEPLMLRDVKDVVQLSSGHHHVCGVRSLGKVICWGGPSPAPVLGVEGVGQTQAPIAVTGLDDAVQVAASVDHTCALRATGEVACWGWLTTGGEAVTAVKVEGVEGAVEITAGWTHDCARLASGKVVCWGGDTQGDDGAREPIHVLGVDDAIQVSAGYNRTCAVRQGGRLVCWDASSTATPQEIDTGEVVHVSVGYDETCAALASGEIACWSWRDGGDVRVFGL
ncbi:hypothetical protein BE04_29355 [Sorangium cellulosum]|uniref:BNR repeat domain protein n=2 Tax=Sorangium cellulosum TaxID=56 RepID=A0A150PUW9_SORCE|nr:hypothetical protein [Sorangium cellulosum]AGP34141.1 hypothetical protein SCE1572_06295 [Sorangium cellulosum So0157-2]KYF59557.1 hypothetical protein BE04_29355 [Sorangium cellulosum]